MDKLDETHSFQKTEIYFKRCDFLKICILDGIEKKLNNYELSEFTPNMKLMVNTFAHLSNTGSKGLT